MSAVPEDVVALALREAEEFKTRIVGVKGGAEIIARAIMADRAARPSVPPVPDAREEAIREDERGRLMRLAREEFLDEGSDRFRADRAAAAGSWLNANGAMLPAERQRLRQETGEA